MGTCEDLVVALEQGRVSDAHAFLALRTLWRDGRVERPGGRSRQHVLLARQMLVAAARGGLVTDEEAAGVLAALKPHGD